MKHPTRLSAFVLALALALGGQAVFAASLSFVKASTSSTLSVAYSSDTTSQAIGKVTIKKGTFPGGDFCVVLTLLSMTQASPEALSYAMYSPAATLANQLSLSGSPTSPSQVLAGNFGAGTTKNSTISLDYAFVVSPTTMPPPGTYIATIDESVYASTYLPSGSPYASNTLKVTVTVGSIYGVSVVPTGGAFSSTSTSQSLNFGFLAPGQSLGADILVRSNVSYSILLGSANSGSLVNLADPTSLIAYSMTSNGGAVPLASGPSSIASGAAATYSSSARYGVKATIAPFSGFPSAGSYADTVTITVSSP